MVKEPVKLTSRFFDACLGRNRKNIKKDFISDVSDQSRFFVRIRRDLVRIAGVHFLDGSLWKSKFQWF